MIMHKFWMSLVNLGAAATFLFVGVTASTDQFFKIICYGATSLFLVFFVRDLLKKEV